MADNSKDELLQLVKRLGAFLTIKISNLLQRLDSRSVGALAGFAFAVVFTWRILRSPTASRSTQQQKRQNTTASSSNISHANTDSASSGVSGSIEDSRAQNVIDEFFQPVKPTITQIVRQRLSEGRKMDFMNEAPSYTTCMKKLAYAPMSFVEAVTCRLLGVILVETSPEQLQKQATVRSSVLEVLLEITKFCDLYLMERVLDDESEKRVLIALEEAGVFTSGGLVKDKVLFCSTETGRTSFVRQLEPDWHIDTNPEIISQLSRFIKYQLYISPTKPDRASSNVVCSLSLEQFFGCA